MLTRGVKPSPPPEPHSFQNDRPETRDRGILAIAIIASAHSRAPAVSKR